MYVGLAWHFWNTRWRTAEAKRGLRAWERVAILAPLALHGWLIYRGIFAAPELRFGFAQALSVMMFLGVILYWIESLFFSLVGMQPLVLGGAALCVLLPYWFPGRAMPGAASADFKIHLALALVAYSVFTIALLHAVLMAVADRLLHRAKAGAEAPARAHPLTGPAASLPPLLTIEQMFFRLVAVAF